MHLRPSRLRRTQSGALRHLLHEGVEKGQYLIAVPSPTKLEKVDRAKPETDEVPLAAICDSPAIKSRGGVGGCAKDYSTSTTWFDVTIPSGTGTVVAE